MLPPDERAGLPDSHRDDRARRITRLLHRRRGWAWTATASLIGFVVYAIIAAAFLTGLSGPLGAAAEAIRLLLLALAVAGLIVAGVDTVRLHRAEEARRRSALSRVQHYPLAAHPYRYPPRHHVSWVFLWLVLALWMVPAALLLPGLVDSTAYLAGVAPRATFVPVKVRVECGRGCNTYTDGYLEPGGARITWPGLVAGPIPVRAPLWRWGVGEFVIDGTGSAIGTLILSLIIDGAAVLITLAAVNAAGYVIRERRRVRASYAGLPGRE